MKYSEFDVWLEGYDGRVNSFHIARYKRLMRGDYSSFPGAREDHHVIPSSLGGIDSEDNIISLPLRLHYLAHRILRLALPDSWQMHSAYVLMSNRMGFKRSRDYEESRLLLSERMSKLYMGNNNPLFGRRGVESHRYGVEHTAEARAKMSRAARASAPYRKPQSPMSDEGRRNISESKRGNLNPNYGVRASEETRARMSASQKEAAKSRRPRKETPPWAKKHSARSIEVWRRADEVYALWVKGLGPFAICRALGFDIYGDFRNKENQVIGHTMFGHFRRGFIPESDRGWVEWKNGLNIHRPSMVI